MVVSFSVAVKSSKLLRISTKAESGIIVDAPDGVSRKARESRQDHA